VEVQETTVSWAEASAPTFTSGVTGPAATLVCCDVATSDYEWDVTAIYLQAGGIPQGVRVEDPGATGSSSRSNTFQRVAFDLPDRCPELAQQG
jgi:hypothetical protein